MKYLHLLYVLQTSQQFSSDPVLKNSMLNRTYTTCFKRTTEDVRQEQYVITDNHQFFTINKTPKVELEIHFVGTRTLFHRRN